MRGLGLIILFTGTVLSSLAMGAKADSQDISVMCKRAVADYQLPDCIIKFRNKYIDRGALNTCYLAVADYQLPECVLDMSDMRFTDITLEACKLAVADYQLPSCMKKLKNLNITSANLNTCQDAVADYQLPDCLLKVSEVSSGAVDYLEMALDALREKDYREVRNLIYEALKALN